MVYLYMINQEIYKNVLFRNIRITEFTNHHCFEIIVLGLRNFFLTLHQFSKLNEFIVQ